MYDIITIGSATRDVFIIEKDFVKLKSKKFQTGVGQCLAYGTKVEVDKIVFDTGGGATNTAVTFSRFGLKTAVFSKVGNDDNANSILSALKRENIETRFITIDKNGTTAYSTILSGHRGDRTVLVFRGVSSQLFKRNIPIKKAKTKWFYITSLGGDLKLLKYIVQHSRKNGIKIALNPGDTELKYGLSQLSPILQSIQILLLNREEAAKLAQKKPSELNSIFKELYSIGHNVVAITDGPSGAYVFYDRLLYFSKAVGGLAINSLGAGDAFGSGFVAGFILKNDIEYALALGILNSGSVVKKIGAKNGILNKLPSLKELKKIKIKKLSNKFSNQTI